MEKLVEFDTAKLAYDKGFNDNDKGYYVLMYSMSGELMKEKLGYQKYQPEILSSGFVLAPTQSVVQKWLRDSHNINITVHFDGKLKKWKYEYSNIFDHDVIDRVERILDNLWIGYDTYEDALEHGLCECLQKLSSPKYNVH